MRHSVLSLTSALALMVAAGGVPASAQEETTIAVDTTSDVVDFGGGQTVADLPGPDGQISLREAAIASTNTAGPETIAFDIPTTDPGFDGEGFVILIDPASSEEELTLGDDGTTLDATTQPGGFSITVEGSPQAVADGRHGLDITSSDNIVIGLAFRLYSTGVRTSFDSDQIPADGNLIIGSSMTENRSGAVLFGTGNELVASTVRDNVASGVVITNAIEAVVDDNTITSNGSRGISIQLSDDTTVTGNLISENEDRGINILASSGGVVTANTITANGQDGIRLNGADRFTITHNSITQNGRLGIDLFGGKEDANGVTKNDSRDRDSGPNELMNYPEQLQATDDGTATVVEGRLRFPDPESVTVEFFASDAPDPSGFGEGDQFLGTATPEGKQGRFTATLPAGLTGQWITATATDAEGNTSEFSGAVQVAASN